MHEFTPLEQRIQIRSDFYHEAKIFSKTDGVMREIALKRIDRLLDEFNLLNVVYVPSQLEPLVQPTDYFPPT